MTKNIAIFSDGTGNSSAKLFKTNVWRLYEALDLSRPDQIAFYDDGVGTSSFKPYAILGGAIGLGLKRNVKHAYAFLSRAYQPGDRIYAFGFSRGAFTIRILIGLVFSQGLAQGSTEAALWEDVNAKWWAYRKRSRTRVMRKVRGRGPQSTAGAGVNFTFVGLWDTVAAYGLPADELTRAWDQYVWPLSMNDRVPCSNIVKAFHALSIDDERNAFHPVLWTEQGEPQSATSTHLDDERISQVWFAGVHANVGGGYPDDSLAFVPLYWIMNEARKRGLDFQYDKLPRTEISAVSSGPMYDSRRGVAGYYRYNPRRIDKLINDDFRDVAVIRPKIHESVFNRMQSGDDRYAPYVLPGAYAVVKADGSIVTPEIESPSQSQARAVTQENAWNWVWARRVVYFLCLIVSGFLAAFPLLFENGACASDYFCFLTMPISVIGTLLPGFADPWLLRFKANPGWFLLAAMILGVLLWTSGWLSRKIRDVMWKIWTPILAAPNQYVSNAQPPSGFIYWLRTRPGYQAFFRYLSRDFFPFLFAIGFYFLAFVLVSRLGFSIFSATGWVCKGNGNPQALESKGVSVSIEAKNPCAATGYILQEGGRYRIWINIPGTWADKKIKADVTGFSEPWLYAFVPFRRWLGEPWFKPIARIGARGNDEYPLDPLVPFPTSVEKRTLATEIHARRSGELFIYVNDAIVFWPWNTYANNEGTAKVYVERVEAPAIPK